MNRKILIIDDDIDLSHLIRDMLEDNGYHVEFTTSLDTAYEILETDTFHLILLDINLPDGTGFEFCEELRRVSNIPVIFASARTSEDDKITGLDMGGDDYIAKPYSIKELKSRINSLIRRCYGPDEEDEVYRFQVGTDKVVEINGKMRSVEKVVHGKHIDVPLSTKEFDLLYFMAKNKGEALSKERLLREVWGAFSEVEPSTLTVHIRWLREKLEDDPSNPAFIKTVWKIGYRLVA